MRIGVLGVGFDALTMDQAEQAVLRLMEQGGGTVVTANPEIVLRCRADAEYARAVNGADLVLADGVGDLLAGRILGTPLPERVAGADLVPRVLRDLARRGGSVFLYGGRPGVAEAAAAALEREYPGLRIAGTENGYISSGGELTSRLRTLRPDLVLAGLGAPKQELWMAENRDGLHSVLIGVGGLLDVFAGRTKRAPESWRRCGLEWAYRLLREPRRAGRMIRLPTVLVLAARERLSRRK